MPRKRETKRRRPRLEVWKFGGASLADAAAVRHAVALVRAHRGPLVVVVSALAGVTDLLLDGARRSVAGEPEAASAAAATFLRRHRDLAHALVPAGPGAARASSPPPTPRPASTGRSRTRWPRSPTSPPGRATRSSPAASAPRARWWRRPSTPRAAGPSASTRRQIVATDGHHGAAAPDLAATRRNARRLLAPAPEARRHAGRARLPRRGPGRHRHDPRPRRLRPHRDAPRPRARRRARRALEGRARHPHRRPARGARRAPPPADAPPRGGGGRVLRREGPPPAGAHPPRRERHRPPRPLVPPPRAARHGGLVAADARRLPGEGARHDPRPGARHGRGQGPHGRARHGRAHLRGDPRGRGVGLDDLPVLVGELDRLHPARGRGGARGARARARLPRRAPRPASWTA